MKQELFLLDIDTQVDFFLPQGSRYTSQSRAAGENVRHLFGWAWTNRIPVISTVLVDDLRSRRIREKISFIFGLFPMIAPSRVISSAANLPSFSDRLSRSCGRPRRSF